MTVPHPTLHARAGETSLAFAREFDAPAALVFRAHTEVALFVRWMGPSGTTCHVERFDAVTGGGYRYSIGGGDGAAWTFFGSYHEVTAPHRLVHTWEFEGDRGRPTLESLTFVDLPVGRCRLDGLSVYTSAEQCTEMLAFDETSDGMDENFVRLDGLLAALG